jgi:hypothetical protein
LGPWATPSSLISGYVLEETEEKYRNKSSEKRIFLLNDKNIGISDYLHGNGKFCQMS